MRKHRILVLFVAMSALAIPCQVAADDDEDDRYGPDDGDWELSLGANGNSDKEFDSGGFSFGGSLGYFLTEGFELGVRQSISYFDAEDTESAFAGTTRGFLDYNIDLDRFRPFLGVNAGYRYGNGAIDETGIAAPEVGVKFFALEKTFLMASMEYQFFFEDVDDADDNFDDGQFVYGLAVGFNF